MTMKSQEREIDGMQFTITQVPGMAGLKLFARLGRVLGPALASAFGDMKGASTLADIDLGKLGNGLSVLFEKLSDAELESLTRELLKSGTVVHEGQSIPILTGFDLVFQGKTMTLLKVLAFSIEVNFGSFLDVLRGIALQQMTATPSKSKA